MLAFVPGMGGSKWSKASSDGATLYYPPQMEVRYDLNDDAALQFAVVEEKDGEILEHYVIVLVETKKEIESYELGFEFDAKSYWEIAVESLGEGVSQFKVLTPDPDIVEINDMPCVQSEMWAALGDIEVFYKMGVYEGKTAFYQVLTWTINDQRDLFEKDMDQILIKFRGK